MANNRTQIITATALVVCVVFVGFWEIMSSRSNRAFDTFELTNESFAGFEQSNKNGKFIIKSVPVVTTVMEPNVAAFIVGQRGQSNKSLVLSRLVHGYNMRDCMRIKGYTVELIADTREGHETVVNMPKQLQIWRLTSSSGDVSVWVTSMLKAGDFAALSIDVCSMAFPRIGMEEDPNWIPHGLTWSSMRHPIENTKKMLNAKWNNSRCDIWTFLRLKRPAWASEDMLTLVSAYRGDAFPHEKEMMIIENVVAAHVNIMNELQIWRRKEVE
jgi:hypothetical protein